jgi:RNA recognition motif-containing protein
MRKQDALENEEQVDRNENDENAIDEEEEGNGEELESNKRKRKRKRKKKSSTDQADSGDITGATSNSVAKKEDKLSSLAYTVYVEGLPFACTEDEVKDFFVSNGCEDILQLRLPT